MPQLGRQRLRRGVAGRQLANGLDGVQRLVPQLVVEGHLDPRLAADVVEDAVRAPVTPSSSSSSSRLGAELDGVVVPVRRLAVVAGRAGAALVFDRVRRAVLLLDQVELAGDAQPLGAELDAAGVQRVAFLARPVLEVRIVDAAVLEQAVLDVLVDRHDGLDVFQVVEARAVGDLVEGANGDQVSLERPWDFLHAKRGQGQGRYDAASWSSVMPTSTTIKSTNRQNWRAPSTVTLALRAFRFPHDGTAVEAVLGSRAPARCPFRVEALLLLGVNDGTAQPSSRCRRG